MQIQGNKVIVSRNEIRVFNASWPCSTLRAERSYWFEFASNGDLVDTDCPEHDDGPAATAPCRRLQGRAIRWRLPRLDAGRDLQMIREIARACVELITLTLFIVVCYAYISPL